MVRPRNHATGAQPFDTLAVADIGDVGVCLYDIKFVLLWHQTMTEASFFTIDRSRTIGYGKIRPKPIAHLFPYLSNFILFVD